MQPIQSALNICFPVEGDEIETDALGNFFTPIFIVASTDEEDYVLNTFLSSKTYSSDEERKIAVSETFLKAEIFCAKILSKGSINIEHWQKYIA